MGECTSIVGRGWGGAEPLDCTQLGQNISLLSKNLIHNLGTGLKFIGLLGIEKYTLLYT